MDSLDHLSFDHQFDTKLVKRPEPSSGMDNTIGDVNEDDYEAALKILQSSTTGSKVMFVALHPDNTMQYLLLNVNRIGAMTVLAEIMKRTAMAVESES